MIDKDRPDWDYGNTLTAPQSVDTTKQAVRIEQLEHSVLYKAPQPHYWSCWTRVWYTPDGALRVAFLDMTGGPTDLEPSYQYECMPLETLSGMGIRRRDVWIESRDEGRSWSVIRETDRDDGISPQRSEYLTLNDGTLLGIGGLLQTWDTEAETYAIIGHAMAYRSSDGGRTWSEPTSLNDPDAMAAYWCHPRQLSEGTIVLPAYGTFEKGNPSPQTDAWLWFSEDGGRTWSAPLLLAQGIETRTTDEPEVAELANGDLLVVLRHANLTLPPDAGLYMNCGQIRVRRTASGWETGDLTPTNMGFRGFPALLRTRDGILICAGSNNQINLSVDDGVSWSESASIVDPSLDRHSHYPRLVELPDGRIMSVYHVGNHLPYPPPEEQWIHATFFRLSRPAPI